jgi:hypothetical protein
MGDSVHLYVEVGVFIVAAAIPPLIEIQGLQRPSDVTLD